MNVIRGSLNQNRGNKRRSAFSKRQFEIPPVFQKLRQRSIRNSNGIFRRLPAKKHLEVDKNANNTFNSLNGINNLQNSSGESSSQFNVSVDRASFYDQVTDSRMNTDRGVFSIDQRNGHDLKSRELGQHDFTTTVESDCNNEAGTTNDSNNNFWMSSEQEEFMNYDSCYSKNQNNVPRQHNDSMCSESISKYENKDSDKLMFVFKNVNEKITNIAASEIPNEHCLSMPVNLNDDDDDDDLSSIYHGNQSNFIVTYNNKNNNSNNNNNDNNVIDMHINLIPEPLVYDNSNLPFLNENPSTSKHSLNDLNFVRSNWLKLNNNDTNVKRQTLLKKIQRLKSDKDRNESSTSDLSVRRQNQFINSFKNITPFMKQSTTNSKIVKKNNQLSGSVSISNGDNQFNDNKLPNNVVNSAGPADLVNRILQTPTGNHHFILPLLTNSIKRGTNLNTPVLVNKQIQSLLPLNSFSDSGKRNNRSDSSSGPHPHTTPSDKLRTPRSTSGSHDSNHNVILAITEGRGLARGEIGIAVMDIKRPQLILCQISDAQTYTNTLAKINFFNPVEILIPNTFVEKPQSVPLFDLINDCFPDVSLTTVQRRHYNDKVGLSQIQNLCLPEYLSIDLIIKHKFYALAAAAALIKYIEFSQTVLFSKRSIKVEYQGAEDIMTIDMESAKQLELVLCNSGGGYEQSLLGILNHCSTVSGRRCLRANILQPPYNHQVTEMRLNCVTELVEDPNLLASLKRELVKFEDVEQLLWLCLQLPNLNVTDKPNEVQMNFILLLKATLVALPNLVDCLKDAKVSYFHDCLVVLRDSRYSNILEIVHKSINEDARVVKGFMASQHQRCFAIKPEVNGLLDVARSTYSNLIEETRNKVIELSKEYNLPLKLSSSNSKGMHIQLSLMQNRSFSVKDLPPLFIQVNRVSKNLITCTTEDILILNQRMKHALREIQLMSNVIVGEILHKVREHIGCLYKLCEIIAELDILLSFALVSSSTDFVRPTFGHKMKLIASRHPILDVINRSRPVGNNVIASKEKNFHIITGPNMGGKSIYIRQVALLQIMAQIGCYVPAESAQFCSIHSLFTRIGFDDSIEHNASTFRLEMWQMKYILQSAAGDHCSLILVDELCRGTCSEEGTAIAWALCQELAALNAFTFFTTHFNFLTQLEYVHSNITNWHFEVEECEHGRLIYTHKLLSGANKVSSYGIQLAKQTSLPNSVLKFILEFYNELSSMKQAVTSNLDSEIESNQQFIDILSNKIIDLIDNGKSSEEIIYVLEELSTSKNHVASFNSQDSINYREQDAECNDDNNNDNGSSYNLHERMYNVEVQLEELDVVINNIDDDDNNSDSIKDNNEPFTTQDCVDMLEDSTVQIGNSEMVVDETVDRLNLTETVKEGNLHVD